jgi:RimJ/RimL family protein N-acetyltransferase
MNNTNNPRLISVRDLSIDEIPSVLNYWFHSPLGFIEGIGVDLGKMPKETDMRNNLILKIQENEKLASSKLNALAILCNDRPIGFHTINPLIDNDYGIFHAHIWEPRFRRQGIGMQSYPLACGIFMERFNLNRIVFKTPIRNIGAIRTKEKLGIRCIGEELIGFGIIKDNTPAKVFELTVEEAKKLFN